MIFLQRRVFIALKVTTERLASDMRKKVNKVKSRWPGAKENTGSSENESGT